ncbi:MAG: hypothetical protein QM831_20800 [Kofleriaceae bacterium]
MRSKVLIALVVVLVIAGLLWRHHEQQKTLPPPPPELVNARDQAVAPVKPEPPKVRRLSPEERKKLGDDIHASLKRSVDKPPSLPSGGQGSAPALADGEPLLRLEDIAPAVKSTFDATIPEFAKCFEGKTADKTAMARMTLVSDPDLGTVIDTPQMTDGEDKPLPKDIDDCLRNTADSLALPSIGKAGRLPVQYTFKFD